MIVFNATALALFAVLFTVTATAQNMSFGADNFYVSDIVTVQPVTFPNQYRMAVSGNLFQPNNLSRSLRSPAIIVGHPMGAVKEQSSNLHAAKLAEQGFITLSIDLSFWGGSEGEPRNAVLPDLYAEAFSAAVDYLSTQDFVDHERIGGLGICGSGSFLISAAKIDPRIRAVATSSMYDMGAVSRHGLRNAVSIEQRKQAIGSAVRQRSAEVDGGEIAVTGGTPVDLTEASTEIDREFFDFYRTSRGAFTPEGTTPERTTRPTWSSLPKFMNFYPFQDMDIISPRAMLFVTGDRAHSLEFSVDAYNRAGEPKELFWVPNAGHVDLYDRVDLIPFTKLTQFFKEYLSGPGPAENTTQTTRH